MPDVVDGVLSTGAGELYRRLLAGEYHPLGRPPDAPGGAAGELVAAGFARVGTGDPPLLVPVAPAVAAQQVLNGLTARLSTWQEQATTAVQRLIELQRDALSVDGRPVRAPAEVITGAAQVIALVDGVQRDARRELLSLDTTAAAGSACRPRLSPAADDPPPRWRTVFTTDFVTPELTGIVDATADRGGEVRIAPALPMKLLIADAATALVPLDDSGSAGVVLFRSPTVVGALTVLFDSVWERATPYPVDRGQPGALTPYQRQVLALLAASLRDEEIAARTHVSIRTVRRNVAAVLDHLGVTTRFAAGVQAAKRGWL